MPKVLALDANNNTTEISLGDSIEWSLLTGVPVYATRWPTWDEVSGKPTAFPPAAHTHTISQITGLQDALDGKQPAGSYAAAVHTHSASDITSGTLSDERLPSTMGGKTFTSAISAPSVALGSQAIYLYESDSDGSFTVRTGPAGGPYGWFAFGADGNLRVLNAGAVYAQSFRNNSGASGPKYVVGDDAELWDVNQADTLGVRGQQDEARGWIQFGNAPGRIGWDGASHVVETSLRVAGNVAGVRILGGDVSTNTSNPVCGGRNGQSNWNSAGVESFCNDGGWAVITLHRHGYSHVNLVHTGGESLCVAANGNDGGVEFRAAGEIWLGDANNPLYRRRQPRIFVQAGDPGAAAVDGDLWIW